MNVAAILYEMGEGLATDELLTGIAHQLRDAGLKLAGAVQSNSAAPRRSQCEMTLEDLATGRCTKASEDRGPLARGCRLDAGALEDVVGLAASSLGSDTALVVINRFGKQEAEGHGFRPMIENAVLLGVPVLLAVNRAHLESWSQFVGGEPVLLPARREDVVRWCEATVPGASSAWPQERSPCGCMCQCGS
jgi:nucleoside-triphosphatase THEP1